MLITHIFMPQPPTTTRGAREASLERDGVAGPLEEGLEVGRQAEERVVQDPPELEAGRQPSGARVSPRAQEDAQNAEASAGLAPPRLGAAGGTW